MLNYHHLFYFLTVVREGGLLPAARKLRVTHSTVAAQVRTLEEQLGERLLVRSGRRLVPTEAGKIALTYAEEIFDLGVELTETLRRGTGTRPVRLRVGIVDVVPKLVVHRLLAAAYEKDETVRLVCTEEPLPRLVTQLASHEIDLVVSDAPAPPNANVRVYSHFLGESGVALFAAPELARRLSRGFPASLAGTPVVWPTEGTTLRRSLDGWLAEIGVNPRIVAEVEDSALLKSFGQAGAGAFPAPLIVRSEVEKRYNVRSIGIAEGISERFYLVTAERRFVHPAMVAITERARSVLGQLAEHPKRASRASPRRASRNAT